MSTCLVVRPVTVDVGCGLASSCLTLFHGMKSHLVQSSGLSQSGRLTSRIWKSITCPSHVVVEEYMYY